ncbi:MarR family winged helix-turn-helix transcriptional regulator [Actinomadura madurae]|uniref:MarR family winged helix-turn-helix transcriptional regulator n=1 Tax=Actinomadura madurae TaxID=1993 RepID=UPI0020D209F7|nr:MarR family winged helix-turn-helix transcriptional regulator [Actinomadura madurae]MCP9948511.1 MarR family winged helix-turn-helix transcriptional regulator [Actinomadura madurae]
MRLGRDGVPGGGRGGAPRQGQRGQGGGEGGLLERSAYILLSRVRIEGPMSIRQLSEAFDLDPSTLNRQTSAMLRAGLVERIPDPEGGIARKFRITSEGSAGWTPSAPRSSPASTRSWPTGHRTRSPPSPPSSSASTPTSSGWPAIPGRAPDGG